MTSVRPILQSKDHWAARPTEVCSINGRCRGSKTLDRLCLARGRIRCNDLSMANATKNLRRPLTIEINGHECVMLTIGHLANAVGRTPWSINQWIRAGLIPPSPVLERPDTPNLRRRLWPAEFVAAMRVIGKQDYVVRRLDRRDFRRFHSEVMDAYELTIAPLLEPTVTECVANISVDE